MYNIPEKTCSSDFRIELITVKIIDGQADPEDTKKLAAWLSSGFKFILSSNPTEMVKTGNTTRVTELTYTLAR